MGERVNEKEDSKNEKKKNTRGVCAWAGLAKQNEAIKKV